MLKSTNYSVAIQNPVNRVPLFNLFKFRWKRFKEFLPKRKKIKKKRQSGVKNVESRFCWLREMDLKFEQEWVTLWFKLCMCGTLKWRFKQLWLSFSVDFQLHFPTFNSDPNFGSSVRNLIMLQFISIFNNFH